MSVEKRRILAKHLARKSQSTFSEALNRVKKWLNNEDSEEFKVICSIFDSMEEYAKLCVARSKEEGEGSLEGG